MTDDLEFRINIGGVIVIVSVGIGMGIGVGVGVDISVGDNVGIGVSDDIGFSIRRSWRGGRTPSLIAQSLFVDGGAEEKSKRHFGLILILNKKFHVEGPINHQR